MKGTIDIRYCTRCGRIIKGYKVYFLSITYPFPFIREDRHEFCEQCHNEFKEFMSEKGFVKYKKMTPYSHQVDKQFIQDYGEKNEQ